MEQEKIVAMAVATIAEETGIRPMHITVRSFKEVQKSDLEKFIEDNNIAYRKYVLEEKGE